MSGLGDGARLAVGTLSVLPTPPPRRVDRLVAGRAMVLAPVVGLLLAVLPAGLLWLLAGRAPLLVAGLAVALLAVLTRAMHLDGLADTADGLGSRRRREQALEIMRRSDIGPFGVVTLVLVLLLQVAALASVGGAAPGTLLVALVSSRAVLPALCLRRVPSARPDGLGAMVAGSVGPAGALVAAALVAAGGVVGVLLGLPVTLVLASVVSALGAGAGLGAWCVHRLGGITGDVLGACVEVAFTAALVAAALLR